MESRNPIFARMSEFSKKDDQYAVRSQTQGSAPADPWAAPQYHQQASQGAYSATGYQTQPGVYPQQGYGTPDQLNQMYAAPAANAMQTGRMTLDDVVTKTAIIFGVLLVAALPSYVFIKNQVESTGSTGAGYGIVTVAMLVAMGLGIFNSVKRIPSPPLILAFAVAEGIFVGGVSGVYDASFGGIVIQAVLATLCAFAAMLGLYKSGLIRNSPRFTKIIVIATVGYFLFGLVNFIGVMAHWWDSLYFGANANPMLVLGLALFGTVLATLNLVLDFDYVEKGIESGIPQVFAWSAAFGLASTLVWMYLEILRLLAILNSND